MNNLLSSKSHFVFVNPITPGQGGQILKEPKNYLR